MLTWRAFRIDETGERAVSAVRKTCPAVQTLWLGEGARAEDVSSAVITSDARLEVCELTAFSREVLATEAHEVVDHILADAAEHAGVGLAVVDVDVAGGTGEARRTATTLVKTRASVQTRRVN